MIPDKVNWHLPVVKNGSLILPSHSKTGLKYLACGDENISLFVELLRVKRSLQLLRVWEVST